MGLFDKFKKNDPSYDDEDIVAVCDGELVTHENISDMTFAKELLGQTIAIKPSSSKMVSPANGTLEVLFPTRHAYAIRRNDGTGILVHIGIDTVSLNGKGFKALHKQGDKVNAGDPIIEVDLEAIKEAGYDPITMIIITEPSNDQKISYIDPASVTEGQKINK